VEADPDAAATSVTVPAEQANAKVAPRSLLLTMPEQWLHVVFLLTDLQDMPNTRTTFSYIEEEETAHSECTLNWVLASRATNAPFS